MNGMMGLGNLSTEKEINRLRHGLESCITCLVRQEKSKDEVSLTNIFSERLCVRRCIKMTQDKRSYSALGSKRW